MGIHDFRTNITNIDLSEIKTDIASSASSGTFHNLPQLNIPLFDMQSVQYTSVKLPPLPLTTNFGSVQLDSNSNFPQKSWDEFSFFKADFNINQDFSFNSLFSNLFKLPPLIPAQINFQPLNMYQQPLNSTLKIDNNSTISNLQNANLTSTKKDTPIEYPHDKYFSKMLEFVLTQEKGFVNHPNDRGGRTNMGITQRTYDRYRKSKELPIKHVKNITREEVTEIYHNIYVDSGADKVSDPQLAMCIFDWAIHSGAKNKALQRAIKECNGDVKKFIQARSKFLHNLIARDSSQKVFKRGWDNRINDLAYFVNTNLPSNYA